MMATNPEVTMRVWRGDAKGGAFKDYRVPVQEGMVVLDVIHTIQATQAGDLACRWNCKAGKCGSCSAEINGKPRLMCMTRMDTFDPGETVTVSPIKTFPLYRDLATDVSFNFERAKEMPAFKPRPKEADGTRRMQQEDVERSQEFRKCIECRSRARCHAGLNSRPPCTVTRVRRCLKIPISSSAFLSSPSVRMMPTSDCMHSWRSEWMA